MVLSEVDFDTDELKISDNEKEEEAKVDEPIVRYQKSCWGI